MSWDVYLKGADGATVAVEAHEEGGTYVMGGNPEAHLNVTYNYSMLYRMAGMADSLRTIEGLTGFEAATILKPIIEKLGTRRYDDYWADTPGNAGYALSILLKWAEQYPDATFEVH